MYPVYDACWTQTRRVTTKLRTSLIPVHHGLISTYQRSTHQSSTPNSTSPSPYPSLFIKIIIPIPKNDTVTQHPRVRSPSFAHQHHKYCCSAILCKPRPYKPETKGLLTCQAILFRKSYYNSIFADESEAQRCNFAACFLRVSVA